MRFNHSKFINGAFFLSAILPIFLSLFVATASFAAGIKSVEGTISPDIDGPAPFLELFITISNFTEAELASLKADPEKTLLDRIGIILPDSPEFGGSYIQTIDEELTTDFNHGFYWDKAGTDPGILTGTVPADAVLSYTIRVLQTTGTKAQKLSTLLKTVGEVKGIKAKAVFFVRDAQGVLSVAQGSGDQVFTIEQTYAMPNEAPDGFTAAGTHKQLSLNWTVKSKVKYTDDGKERSVNGVIAIIAKNTNGAPIVLDSAAKVSSLSAEPPTAGKCTLTPPDTAGASCIVCENDPHTYLEVADLAKIPGMEFSRALTNTGTSSIANIDDEQTYTVALQYKSGLIRTACYNVASINNISLLEFNGEKEGKPEDLRCFIATAAFGSPLDHHVKMFRWFRDRYLTGNALGQAFVDLYYNISPRAANFIAEHAVLKAVTRTILTPIAGLLYLFKWFSEHETALYSGFLALVLLGIFGARARLTSPS
jgi:hypothetical protein